MDIRSIRNDDDHHAALEEISALWNSPQGTPEGDRLDVLLDLVEVYETRRWTLVSGEHLDAVDMIQYAIDELGRTQADLARILGSRSRASEILSRKRRLTVEMIDTISKAWHIPVAVLAKPYALATNAA